MPRVIDHYRTLGVAATADEAVIRRVYVALMKRFHPDRNASPETLRQAQAINEAYAVLSDPSRRAAYDDEREGLQPWDRAATLAHARPRRSAAPLVAMALTLAAAGGLYTYWPMLMEPARGGRPTLPIASAPARCASLADPERIRTALIVRLDEAGALDRAAAGALSAAKFELGAAIDARDLAAPGEIACLATLAITLPPSFRTAGGQGTILSELQYSLSRTAPDRGLSVQPDGRLVAALSAIRHEPLGAVENPMLAEEVRVEEESPAVHRPPMLAESRTSRPPAATLPTKRDGSRESTPLRAEGRTAETRGAVPSGGLGGVDRETMNFYAQSLGHANAEKRGRLARTHGAFAARLAACGSDPCRREAYLARNVEISRIMMGD